MKRIIIFLFAVAISFGVKAQDTYRCDIQPIPFKAPGANFYKDTADAVMLTFGGTVKNEANQKRTLVEVKLYNKAKRKVVWGKFTYQFQRRLYREMLSDSVRLSVVNAALKPVDIVVTDIQGVDIAIE